MVPADHLPQLERPASQGPELIWPGGLVTDLIASLALVPFSSMSAITCHGGDSTLEPGFLGQGLARLGPLGEKYQGYAVVAVALAGGLGAVIEDMALVAPTALAMVFGARNDQFEIHFRGDATR